ncbi:MAG: hypothetical protein ACQR33_03730, partial [Candidatus Saccharibacteria bacterium]
MGKPSIGPVSGPRICAPEASTLRRARRLRYTACLSWRCAAGMSTPLVVDINPIAFHLGPVQVHWY